MEAYYRPAEIDLAIPRGVDWDIRLEWTTEDVPGEAGTPVDLTGHSALMQVRTSADSETVLLELSSADDGGLVLGDTDGSITISVPRSVSQPLIWNSGEYDLIVYGPESTDPSIVLARGSFSLYNTITQLPAP